MKEKLKRLPAEIEYKLPTFAMGVNTVFILGGGGVILGQPL